MFRIILWLIFLPLGLAGVEFIPLQQTVNNLRTASPFTYNLNVQLIKGRSESEKVLLLLHGMGSDHRIADIMKSYDSIPAHLISFDFPDAAVNERQYDPRKTTFGSIQEILPVLYLLKKLVVEGGLTSIDLFGFSAGGGAVINTIAVLNTDRYEAQLQNLGIGKMEKRSILNALQNGVILLDVPLKSIQEIIETRGRDASLDIIGSHYRANGFEPIDALRDWKGVSMRVIVYFEVPDESLSNRDDDLYIQRLKSCNTKGTVQAIKGSNGGHASYHTPLWKAYLQSS